MEVDEVNISINRMQSRVNNIISELKNYTINQDPARGVIIADCILTFQNIIDNEDDLLINYIGSLEGIIYYNLVQNPELALDKLTLINKLIDIG